MIIITAVIVGDGHNIKDCKDNMGIYQFIMDIMF
jgi:hypothetical protein